MEKRVNLIAILYSPKYTSKFTYLDNDSWIASKRRQDVPLPGRRFNLGIKILVFIYLSSFETFNLEKVIFLGASPPEKFRFHLCEKFFPIISSWKHLLEQILGNQWVQINWRAYSRVTLMTVIKILEANIRNTLIYLKCIFPYFSCSLKIKW